MNTRARAVLIAMVFLATNAGADDKTAPLSTLAAGDRVNVKVIGSPETLVATIESVTADELVVNPGGAGQPLRLSVGQLGRLDVARGQRSQWRKGAVIGLIPGAVLGGIAGAVATCDPYASTCDPDATLATAGGLFGAVVFGGATATVGALIGLAFKTDKWVRLHDGKAGASVILAPTDGGMRVGLSFSF
jgi:hypothetical protein